MQKIEKFQYMLDLREKNKVKTCTNNKKEINYNAKN